MQNDEEKEYLIPEYSGLLKIRSSYAVRIMNLLCLVWLVTIVELHDVLGFLYWRPSQNYYYR